MTVKDLETLYDYGNWANKRLLDVLSTLTPEQFTMPVTGSSASVRHKMVHMLSAEWGWLDRCGGEKRGPALSPGDYPTAEALAGQWMRVDRSMRSFLLSLRDQDLVRLVEFSFGGGPKYAMPLGELLHHAAIHGIHHRGQVSMLLRSLGCVPPGFDILFYYGRAAGLESL